jgi:GT2 family glycosyltransferase
LDALEEALARSKNVAAVAPRLIDSHGQPQIGFNVRRLPTPLSLIFEILLLNRLFPSNPVNRRYRCLDLDPEQAAEVEQPAGACLLVRRSDFERCGGFDEGFFPLWFEDADLCFRLRQQGGAILYYPQVSFEHQGGHSVESLTFSEKQIYWYRNLLYYVYKHFPTGAGLAVRGALFWGVGFRMVADVLGLDRYRSRSDTARGERLRAYWNAAKLSLMDWRRLGSGL